MDELDAHIADHAAALSRKRARLRSRDGVILATAQVRRRILATRNTTDFSADLPRVRVPYII